jgi:cation transport protein ChaC
MVLIFGYGSLMWNPGFRFARCRPAVVEGWRRSWCVRSTHYRGCEANNGYVLGLARGGACGGLVFEIDGGAAGVLDLLDRRETRERGYRRTVVEATCDGQTVPVWTFVCPDPALPTQEELARAYLTAAGAAGPNRDYVDRTRRALAKIAVAADIGGLGDGLPDEGPWNRSGEGAGS